MYSQEQFKIRFTLCSAILFLIFAIKLELNAQSQSYHTLRSFQTVPHALQFDVGKIPNFRLFVGPPYVSNLNVTLNTNGPTLGDLGLIGRDGFFGNNFNELIENAEDFNEIEIDNKLDLVYFGYRYRNNFFTFHISDNLQMRSFYPKPLFELLDDVNEGSTDLIGNRYDLFQLGVRGKHYRSFGLGYRGAINEYVSIGGNIKYLQGLNIIQSSNSELALSTNNDSDFFNIENSIDFLYTGLAFLADEELSPTDYFNGNSNGNSGFAFDLGLNLSLNDQLEFFVTAIDIGGLNWKNRIQEFSLNNGSIQLSSNNLDQFEEVLDTTFEDAFINEEIIDTTINTSLTSQAFVGGTFRFKKYYTVGLVANPRFREGNVEFAGSAAFSALVNNYLEVALNANFDQDNFNVGAGFVFNGGPFQLYLASDNILSAFQLADADNLAISLGTNLVFGRRGLKRKKKKKFKKPVEETVTPEDRLLSALEEAETEEEQETENTPENEIAATPVETETPTTPEESVAETPETAEEEEGEQEVTLNGIAIDNRTNEKLKGIAIEFYWITESGEREVLLFHAFYNGNISLHMQNSNDHVLVIKKQGYTIKEFKIPKSELTGKTTITKQFPMNKEG